MPDSIIEKMKRILSMIDRKDYPETVRYLKEIVRNDEQSLSGFDTAMQLLRLDKPKELPAELIDLISSLFDSSESAREEIATSQG